MKKNIICFLLLFIFGCTVLGGCSNGPKEYQKVLSEEEIAQLREDEYPICSPYILADKAPPMLENTISIAPYAVLEFVEKLPDIENIHIPVPGTSEAILAEKWEIEQYTFYYPSYKFRVIETLTGNIPDYLVGEDKTITISLPALYLNGDAALPQFKEGERYIAIVGESQDGGELSRKYHTAWFDPSCVFYVTDQECVLSSVMEEGVEKYSGYRLNDFKGILQEMERNPPESVSE